MSLGDRMKAYEHAARVVLPPRMPVIIRVDGKTFHTYTRGCARPFDAGLIDAMNRAAVALCEEAQTTQIAYVQSDEISLLLHPYKRYASQPWFANEVQKLCSIAASIAAATVTACSALVFGETRPAYFDARVFVLPESEVCNYFIWRQQDAERNSVQMLARSLFSHRECHQKNCTELRAMCAEHGHEWTALPAWQRLGRVAVRERYTSTLIDGTKIERSRWIVPEQTPRFVDDRDAIDALLAVEPEGVT